MVIRASSKRLRSPGMAGWNPMSSTLSRLFSGRMMLGRALARLSYWSRGTSMLSPSLPPLSWMSTSTRSFSSSRVRSQERRGMTDTPRPLSTTGRETAAAVCCKNFLLFIFQRVFWSEKATAGGCAVSPGKTMGFGHGSGQLSWNSGMLNIAVSRLRSLLSTAWAFSSLVGSLT